MNMRWIKAGKRLPVNPQRCWIFCFQSAGDVLVSGMNLRMTALVALFALTLNPAAPAGGKAGEMGMVTFHLETEAGGNPKMVFSQNDDGKERFFSRTPEITMKDMVAFLPFPSGGGDEYGILFQLKDPARRRLNAISLAHQGKFLLAQINGRIVDGVVIDKPVDDGLIVVWKGLSAEDVKLFDKALPRMGDDKKKKK
jgi:hypothetical protein